MVEDGPDRERAIDLLAEKYPQYAQQRPKGSVMVIDVGRISSWEGAIG